MRLGGTELWAGGWRRLVLSGEGSALFCPWSLDITFVSCQLQDAGCWLLAIWHIVPNGVAHFQHLSFHFFWRGTLAEARRRRVGAEGEFSRQGAKGKARKQTRKQRLGCWLAGQYIGSLVWLVRQR